MSSGEASITVFERDVLSAAEAPLQLPDGVELTIVEELVGPQRERRKRFVMARDGGQALGSAILDVPWGRTSTHALRKGVTGELSDQREITILRNGPRPTSRFRRATTEGAGLRWVAEGEAFGTHVRDDDGGANIVRTRVNRHAIDSRRSPEELALAFALIAHGIPQSLSFLNANWLP